MKRTSISLLGIILSTLIFLPIVRAAEGEISQTVAGTTDYFVVVTEPIFFTARTLLCDEPLVLWCAHPGEGGHFMDSALWLYDTAGSMIFVNDDDGVSYASLIQIYLEPGFYRLRAGRYGPCNQLTGCMHPEEPFVVGGYYDLLTNIALVLDPEPPVASPPPVPSVLPTPEPTPTIEPTPEPTPTPTIEPTPTPTPTQTPEPPTPSPSVAPSPTPEPSVTPTPTPRPSHSPEVTHEPSQNPSSTPEPTPEPSPAPEESAPPSVDPSLVPTDAPGPIDPGAAVDAVATAVGETIASVEEKVGEVISAVGDVAAAAGEAVGAAVDKVSNLGKDISEDDKQSARESIVPAVIVTQLAAAAKAVNRSSGNSNSGGGGPSGGGEGKKPKSRGKSLGGKLHRGTRAKGIDRSSITKQGERTNNKPDGGRNK